MRSTRWIWIGIGAGAGYLLGARAGRERYESITAWGRKTAAEFGLSPAATLVVETARSTVEDVRDAAASKSQEIFDGGATVISERLESVGNTLGDHA